MIPTTLPKELKSQVLEHPKFATELNRLLAKIRYDYSIGFGLVVGITGVGKSTLMRRLQHVLYQYVKANPELGLVPPIVLSMHAPERKVFSWRDFYQDSLINQLNEPNALKKDDLQRTKDEYQAAGELRKYHAKSIADLRQFFIHSVNDRKPAALLVDEVQELSKVTSREKAHDNLDVLKSLSDRLRIPVVGFGTSKAYEMLYNNEQTARRADVIHFNRYQGTSADIAVFRDILLATQSQLNIPFAKNIPQDVTYFYERTAGCVGVLMDWLKKSIALAIADRAKVVGIRHLDQAALGGEQIAALVRKIIEAEQILAAHENYSPINALGEDINLFEPDKAASTGSPKRKPGQRNPTQDPTGNLLEEALS